MSKKNNTPPKVILVVEDERPLAEAISDKLTKHGFEVASARTCEQAINYLHDLKHIDAIWLDHYLIGNETGLDLIAHAKDHKDHLDVPIFVVSNTASDAAKKTYIQLGIEKYYIKTNMRLDEIVDDIQKYWKNK